MSSSTVLQKRKRLDAHEDVEGSSCVHSRSQDDGRSVEASADAAVPLAGSNTSPKASPDRGTRGLVFATESWTGLKPTNEDRSALCVSGMSPLDPAFAIYDGHGGTFTADFLVRNLFKTVAASVRQQVGDRKMQQLEASTALSRSESVRKKGIKQQIDFVTEQLEQVAQLVDKPISAGSDDKDGSNEQHDETRVLRVELEGMLRDLVAEAQRIEDEELERLEYRCQWFDAQDATIRRAIVDAFKRTDEQVLRKNSSRDGSTALVLWFFGGVAGDDFAGDETSRQGGRVDYETTGFYALNLGDCRAVLCRRGGAAVSLTSDHKPDRPDEKARIEKAGGFVGTFAGIPRVFSAAGAGLAVQSELATFLAVSRAFGDRSLKTPSALVSCEPEIHRYKLEPDDVFILMACDGVWDVLGDEEAVSIARVHIKDPKTAANAVVKAAYKRGSADNLTATLIKFSGHCEPANAQAGVTTSADGKIGRADVEGDHQDGATLTGRANGDTNGADDAPLRNADTDADDEIDMFNL